MGMPCGVASRRIGSTSCMVLCPSSCCTAASDTRPAGEEPPGAREPPDHLREAPRNDERAQLGEGSGVLLLEAERAEAHGDHVSDHFVVSAAGP